MGRHKQVTDNTNITRVQADLSSDLKAPAFLSPIGKKEYSRLFNALSTKGILDDSDLGLLEMASFYYQTFVETIGYIKQEFGTYEKKFPVPAYLKNRTVQNSLLWTALKQSHAEYYSTVTRLGVTPLSRQQIEISTEDTKEENEVAEFREKMGLV